MFEGIVTGVVFLLALAFYLSSQKGRYRPVGTAAAQGKAVTVKRSVVRAPGRRRNDRSLAYSLGYAFQQLRHQWSSDFAHGRAVAKQRAVMSHSTAIAQESPITPAIDAETKPETAAETESETTAVAIMPIHDPQMLAVAELVRTKLVTETAALEVVFKVKAGGSEAYKAKRAQLKDALAYLETLDTPVVAAKAA